MNIENRTVIFSKNCVLNINKNRMYCKTLFDVFIALLVCFIVSLILMFIFLNTLTIVITIMLSIFIIMCFYFYKMNIKKREKLLNNIEIDSVYNYTFYDKYFSILDKDKIYTYKYNMVKHVYHTQDAFHFIMNDDFKYVVDCASFKEEDKIMFIEHIYEIYNLKK